MSGGRPVNLAAAGRRRAAEAIRSDALARRASTRRRALRADQAVDAAGRVGAEAEGAARRVRDRARAYQQAADRLILQHLAALLTPRGGSSRLGRLNYFDVDFWGESDRQARLDALLLAGTDRGNVQIQAADGAGLRIAAQRGFTSSFLDYFAVIDDGSTACGLAFDTAAPVTVADLAANPIFAGTPPTTMLLDNNIRCVHSAPLLGPTRQPIGMLSVHFAEPDRIDQPRRQALALLAATATCRSGILPGR